ncbi:MAG TPA: glycogen/starch/alpha-glucan phosphorylase [Candidatus Cybelea sp.]|nr:glycogen/starch/alpha-glucan phosphorylase [Candidatus Cybelea sp.]
MIEYNVGDFHFSGSPEALYERHLLFDNAVAGDGIGARDRFEAMARSVRDVLSQRWVATKSAYAQTNPKRVYYLSMEYLIGRSLANNVANLMLEPLVTQAVERHGDIDWSGLLEQEPDAGLGNGGLGRLAACFLDSMATLELPAMGYGLRYEFGMFKQSFVNGWQHEGPDNWLSYADPWEIERLDQAVDVHFNCTIELKDGAFVANPGHPSTLRGIPYSRPIVGYGGKTINTLRLWAAAAPDYFDFAEFSQGDFVSAVVHTLTAQSLTRVLYPNDSTRQGLALRFVQEYFLVACSLADIVRRFRRRNDDWRALADKVAIQLNDTHPSIAVAELMRILLDDAQLDWQTAWDLTRRTLAYTNHTLLPEALEKWPVAWFELLLPRHLEIVREIDRQLIEEVRVRFPGDDERVERSAVIEGGMTPQVRMAHLAIAGSHSTNGVSEIHSQLLKTTTVKDLAELYPERFNNKTNGVTPRRWLMLSNPHLAGLITGALGPRWKTDLSQLAHLHSFAGDASFREAFLQIKRVAKQRFAAWLVRTTGQVADPDTIFDCQIKRIHEYKRQLLNALRIVVLYNRLRDDPGISMLPRTFIFAGKAAPAYHLAKLVIKFINSLSATIQADPAMRERINVLFIPEYNVSMAERLIPASDVSNQISTAGYEASGTSNMKFMMNGALTVGTRDGATIEMAQEAGEENLFLFGLSASEVAQAPNWYDPQAYYERDPEIRAALDAIFSDTFNPAEPGIFEPLRPVLSTIDRYLHLADLQSYLDAQQRLEALYGDPHAWASKAIVNVASSGKFSSDRTISEYAREIWGVVPCPLGEAIK